MSWCSAELVLNVETLRRALWRSPLLWSDTNKLTSPSALWRTLQDKLNNQASLQLRTTVSFSAFSEHVRLYSGKYALCAPLLAFSVPSFSSASMFLYLTATWTGFHPALSMALKSSRFATGTTSHAFPKTQMITIFVYVCWRKNFCSSFSHFHCLKPCDMWALTLTSIRYVHTTYLF